MFFQKFCKKELCNIYEAWVGSLYFILSHKATSEYGQFSQMMLLIKLLMIHLKLTRSSKSKSSRKSTRPPAQKMCVQSIYMHKYTYAQQAQYIEH